MTDIHLSVGPSNTTQAGNFTAIQRVDADQDGFLTRAEATNLTADELTTLSPQDQAAVMSLRDGNDTAPLRVVFPNRGSSSLGPVMQVDSSNPDGYLSDDYAAARMSLLLDGLQGGPSADLATEFLARYTENDRSTSGAHDYAHNFDSIARLHADPGLRRNLLNGLTADQRQSLRAVLLDTAQQAPNPPLPTIVANMVAEIDAMPQPRPPVQPPAQAPSGNGSGSTATPATPSPSGNGSGTTRPLPPPPPLPPVPPQAPPQPAAPANPHVTPFPPPELG